MILATMSGNFKPFTYICTCAVTKLFMSVALDKTYKVHIYCIVRNVSNERSCQKIRKTFRLGNLFANVLISKASI